MGRLVLAVQLDSLIESPGFRPGFRLPAEEEMHYNRQAEKDQEEPADRRQISPPVNQNRDSQQDQILNNPKSRRLSVQSDMLFSLDEIFERH